MSLWHHEQLGERDWFDAFSLAYVQGTILRWCGASGRDDILEIQDGFEGCKGPDHSY